jgi:hypothetical protein
MVISLSRVTSKASQRAAVWVDAQRVRIFEGVRFALAKEIPCETHEQAMREADKIVARRSKAGWSENQRTESPWQAWVDDVARAHARVVSHAQSAGVAVQQEFFQFGSPSVPCVPGQWAELEGVTSFVRSSIRVQGRSGNEFADTFAIGIHATDGRTIDGWRSGAIHSMRFWRRAHARSGVILEEGAVDLSTGTLTSKTIGGDFVPHTSAEAFRPWFLRHFEDHVWTFQIAELER